MTQATEQAELLKDFLLEAREHLTHFELALLELETAPAQSAPLQALFRSVHTIKGSCGYFSLAKIEALTHASESLLDRVRDGRLALTREIADAVLVMVDVVRAVLSHVEASGSEGDIDVRPLVTRITQLADGHAVEVIIGEPAASDATSALEELRALAHQDGKIRVDTVLLEKLMNLVGELVLTRNQIVQQAALRQDQPGAAAAQRLSLVTSEIQEVAMKTRMQPMAHVWNRFPRLVRDLCRTCGKRARIELDGKETELDKTLIEAIQDPLIHIVRNAIDHGIEAPSVRAAAGKPAEGRITVRAYHEAGMVNLEVTDDGAGIDTRAVREKAVARGIVSAERAERMTQHEIWNLVFLPGFSTQEAVTSVSGRGVGMDVVKTNIDRIGGTVDLQSEAGRGTILKIKIPLTLAIIPALIVSAAGDRYAIPQGSLIEVVRLHEGDSLRRVEEIQGTPVLRLRGKILPLIYLSHELGTARARLTSEVVSVVILQAGDRSFGLVVDEIHDTEEIVVKPLWNRLKGLTCYAGATVMGDGRVALILEALGLAQRVGVTVAEGRALPADAVVEPANSQTAHSRCQVLLCRLGTDERLAIPLSKVARLEELPIRNIERTGKVEVIQYRDKILPLVRVASLLEERRRRPRSSAAAARTRESLSVVVYAHEGRSVGLVVEDILDILEVEVDLQREAARRGVLGSMVVQGRVTEFLDVETLLHNTQPIIHETQARI